MTEETFKRNQFTFYLSFFEAISRIKSKKRQAEVYEMICKFAFFNEKPDEKDLQTDQNCVLDLVIPVLKTGRNKAWSGYLGGTQEKAKRKQTKSKKEIEIENKIEIEKKKKKEMEYKKEARASRLWELHPSGDLGEAELGAIKDIV